MKKTTILFVVLLLASCVTTPSSDQDSITDRFQDHLDEAVTEENPGILVHVLDPENELSWSGAAGVSDIVSRAALKPNQVFRIASVTKIFVACTILRLYEDGKLQLDDPIAAYISREHNEMLQSGGYDTDEISIRHLLTHSSGLFDHTDSDVYLSSILEDPTQHWTRTDQLKIAIQHGEPKGDTGEKFSYSDTGYILLGEIIEAVSQVSLGEAIQQQLRLNELGIKTTFMENERIVAPRRMHQYLEGRDTYGFDASIDLYGGGGLISTTADLALFVQCLFNNQVFENASTLDTMLSSPPYRTAPATDYRMGIFRTTINGLDAYTHTGFWGTQVVYFPQLNASVAVNYGQHWTERGAAPILSKVLQELQDWGHNTE